MDEQKSNVIELTSEIVANYVSNHAVAIGDLPALIRSISATLEGIGSPTAAPEAEAVNKPTPAQIRKSITHDALISFEDGKSYKTLKRHLTTHGLTLAEYKAKWGLPNDYPTTAPGYSEARSAMAKALGLGQGGRGKKPAPKARAKKA
jgi:predicted transcriptional regulator